MMTKQVVPRFRVRRLFLCFVLAVWGMGQSEPKSRDYCAQHVQSADNPSFTVCGPPAWQCFVGGEYPSDIGDEHDCDILPYIMQRVMPEGEVAADQLFLDLGANAGMCTFLMLSKGYRVITIEGENKFWPWINATLHANPGWRERTTLHEALIGKSSTDTPMVELDTLLPSPTHVRLWKLDVDGTETSVLSSFSQALREGRVDIIQLELIDEEIAESKASILEYIQSFGYHLYVAFAPDKLANFKDSSSSRSRQPLELLEEYLSEFEDLVDVSRPWVQLPDADEGIIPAELSERYAYGSHRSSHYEFVPFCAPVAPANIDTSLCWNQYVAVRIGSGVELHPAFAQNVGGTRHVVAWNDSSGTAGAIGYPSLDEALRGYEARAKGPQVALLFDSDDKQLRTHVPVGRSSQELYKLVQQRKHCSPASTRQSAFLSSVRDRIRSALTMGRARRGEPLPPLFPDPREADVMRNEL